MGKTVPPWDEMRCTSHRVEGGKRWLKNERRGVDHQLRKAKKQMEQAASGTAAESGITAAKTNLEQVKAKKKLMDEDGVVLFQKRGTSYNLDKRNRF